MRHVAFEMPTHPPLFGKRGSGKDGEALSKIDGSTDGV